MKIDVQEIRKDFPILNLPENKDLIYLDSAATSHRPLCVIEAIHNFYKEANANPLRGLYDLSVKATDMYENSRATVADFINAGNPSQIIFTRNCTEGMNLISYAWCDEFLKEGDEIVVSVMEHHSNILPWQMAAQRKKCSLVYLECNSEGIITQEEYQSKINSKTRLVCIGHVSNVLGITNPVKEITAYAHKVGNGGKGACVVVDGAQSAPHIKVDVKDINCDFFSFSGHKLLGPMGIGALYGKMEILEQMQPFMRGGEMIEYVTRESATYAEVPHKFEAGTVNASGAVGLAAAIEYLKNIGMSSIEENEAELSKILINGLKDVPYITVQGSSDPSKHSGIASFTLEGVHPHDIASILDSEKICVRAGHHCAQPLMQYLNVGSTARASLYLYNTEDEVNKFLEAISNVRKWCGY